LLEAVVHAGEARFRPIILTSATAISGLTPLATTGDVLFRPLAITIIFGLAFSTLLANPHYRPVSLRSHGRAKSEETVEKTTKIRQQCRNWSVK
jgi:Cu/Ag efflux pump CusA